MRATFLLLALLSAPVIVSAGEAVQLAVTETSMSEQPAANENALNDLAFYALSLAGTPYKYGGNSPETGFDCSGFVRHVFRETLGMELPHNAREMNALGVHVEPDELRPGDLVFYNTMRRSYSHVGIYLGDSQFVHSPSRGGGIRVENMGDAYWKKRFNGARRVTSAN